MPANERDGPEHVTDVLSDSRIARSGNPVLPSIHVMSSKTVRSSQVCLKKQVQRDKHGTNKLVSSALSLFKIDACPNRPSSDDYCVSCTFRNRRVSLSLIRSDVFGDRFQLCFVFGNKQWTNKRD